MSKQYKTRQGDCLSNIAAKHGFTVQALWEHPDNSELKEKRGNPNVLYPGDIISIPEKQIKEVVGETEVRHRFRKEGQTKLRLQFSTSGEPRENQPYILEIDGKLIEGKTDGDGIVEESISATAKKGLIIIGKDGNKIEYRLDIAALDPADIASGAQARLKNLGFYKGKIDGKLSAGTKAALAQFQKHHGAEETNELDDATVSKLVEVHGL